MIITIVLFHIHPHPEIDTSQSQGVYMNNHWHPHTVLGRGEKKNGLMLQANAAKTLSVSSSHWACCHDVIKARNVNTASRETRNATRFCGDRDTCILHHQEGCVDNRKVGYSWPPPTLLRIQLHNFDPVDNFLSCLICTAMNRLFSRVTTKQMSHELIFPNETKARVG